MLSIAKQHAHQHAQLAAAAAANATKQAKQNPTRKPKREELLADFPLGPIAQKKATKKPLSIAKTAGSPAFSTQTKRQKARLISASAVKRSKALLKKLPRPTLLEQAERSLDTVDSSQVQQRNLRLLTHRSERSTKTKDAMKKILLATTKPSKHAAAESEEEDEDDERDDFDDAELAEFMD